MIAANDHPFADVDLSALRRIAERAARGEGLSASVNVVLVDDRRMRELNRSFRKADRSTNVLSFSSDDESLPGEVYVSLDRAVAESARFGETFQKRLTRLVVHGVLHLAGHDHDRPPKAARMRAAERRYLRKR